jgi:hypothetical protein
VSVEVEVPNLVANDLTLLTAEMAELQRQHASELEHLNHKLKQAHGWIRSAVDNVLYPAAMEIPGMIGTEAEGLGGYSVEVLSSDQMHSDDIAIQRFCEVLKEKMQRNRAKGRGGWDDKSDCTAETLTRMLREHIEKGDPVDVALFSMMLYMRGETIGSAPASEDSTKSVTDSTTETRKDTMQKTPEIPQGYTVESTFGGKWKWESILAPECHSCSGFSTYEEAVTHCRMSNNMDEDDMSLQAWRQQQSPEAGRVVYADINKPSTDYERFKELHLPSESLKNGEF